MSKTDNWGCPNWRNQDSYPVKGDELKGWEWRWEFLRRTPVYRKLWERRSEPDSTKHVTKLNIMTVDYIHHFYNLDNLIDPATPLSDFIESPFINKPGDSFSLPSRQSLGGEWFKERGIESTDTEAKLNYLIDYLELVGLLESSKLPEPGSLFKFFRIDLVHPITDQLKHIRIFEKAWNSSIPKDSSFPKRLHFEKKSRKNWPIYLRLIDARYQTAEPVVIFKQIQDEMEAADLNWREWEDLDNPAGKIMNMQKSAWELMTKASLLL